MEQATERRWYVVHTYSNYENKAKLSLQERVKQYKCEEFFGDVLVPSETISQMSQGVKRKVNRKFFPGYMLVQMVLNDRTWHVVMDTPKVTGFVGGKDNPSTIPEQEVDDLKVQMEDGGKTKGFRCEYAVGDSVLVADGPFQNFTGIVDDISEKGKVRVLVSIFGRSTPVELGFEQLSKK
ncbi:MAG: transcription termination/antitermination protein NusG [Thermodesulfobacteriota bacterium]|nr:transcription termination/antitermination protein NusG [Thermodesulfobacteriota bacterium]